LSPWNAGFDTNPDRRSKRLLLAAATSSSDILTSLHVTLSFPFDLDTPAFSTISRSSAFVDFQQYVHLCTPSVVARSSISTLYFVQLVCLSFAFSLTISSADTSRPELSSLLRTFTTSVSRLVISFAFLPYHAFCHESNFGTKLQFLLPLDFLFRLTTSPANFLFYLPTFYYIASATAITAASITTSDKMERRSSTSTNELVFFSASLSISATKIETKFPSRLFFVFSDTTADSEKASSRSRGNKLGKLGRFRSSEVDEDYIGMRSLVPDRSVAGRLDGSL
jgi:hypothetical protein